MDWTPAGPTSHAAAEPTSELRQLLGSIVREACLLLDADDGAIGIFDRERNVLRIAAAQAMPEGEVGSEFGPGRGLAGRVLATQQPVILDAYRTLAADARPELAANAVLGLPLFWQEDLVGFFGLGARPPRRFNSADIEALKQLGRMAAITIVTAQLYQRERARSRRLLLISEVDRIISADLELEEMLRNAAQAIHAVLGYPNVALPLIDPDEPSTMVLSAVGGSYREVVRRVYRLPIAQGIMGAAAREGRPVLVNDVTADPRYVPTPGAIGIRAELAVPIRLKGQTLGVLNVESEEPFSPEDAAVLSIVADHLALAVKNSRLFEQAQRAAVLEERQRLARDLHDSVTQILASATLIAQSVAPAYARHAGEGDRRIARVVELNRSALSEMRALLKELRPTASSASGLTSELPVPTVARVRSDGLEVVLGEELAALRKDGLETELQAQTYERLAAEREEVLYRIAQEAISNSLRHAGARRLFVELSGSPDRIWMRIRDDGRGFDPEAAARQAYASHEQQEGGMGLSTMRERARSLGGSLRLKTAPGRGTEIEISLPKKRGSET